MYHGRQYDCVNLVGRTFPEDKWDYTSEVVDIVPHN